MVDFSLFTAPYDTALVQALLRRGVDVELVGRPPRTGEATPDVPYRGTCYRRFDVASRRFGAFGSALKAAEHIADGVALALAANRLLHLQWLPFPLADALTARLARRHGPVVMTVHDTAPFNGAPTHRAQLAGFRVALGAADRLIVHTAVGRSRLVALGLDPARVVVVPHGPLGATAGRPERAGPRFTLVAFGKMRPYKGLDVLLDALARLDPPPHAPHSAWWSPASR